MSKDNLITKDFRGYKQASLPNIDESLSRVDLKHLVENILDVIGIQ